MSRQLIPTGFQVLGCNIEVELRHPDNWDHDDAVGMYDPMNHKITVVVKSQQMMEHAFYHELVHCILFALGKNELSEDESFVDTFAGLLHQAMKTATYEAKTNGRKKG
jgi:hypothetical protein